jgi:4-amino-4-deoxy-L-arabinose transferase-like glycosyltransferase
VPRLFERVYLRKPPGMFWAEAASARVLGETEFSARAVSALAMTASVLVVFFVSRRWFGKAGGLAAGVSQTLTPLWWSPGRSAEIESLNNMLTQAACLLVVDAIVRGRVSRVDDGAAADLGAEGPCKADPLPSLVLLPGVAIGVGGALLVKGPACAAAIGATLLAGGVVARSFKVIFRPAVLTGILLGMGAFGLWAWMAERAIAAMEIDPIAPVVRQGMGDFLFGPGWMAKLPLMPVAAMASVMPAAGALLFVFGRDAWSERDTGEEARVAHDAARVLSLGALLGVVALTLAGVTNPRYAMPVLTLVPPLVGYVVWGTRGGFGVARARMARGLMLGNPVRLGVVMTIAALVATQIMENSRAANSARDAGEKLGAALAQHATARGDREAEVWADHAIEARPEALEWCIRKARGLGVQVHARWVSLGEPASPRATKVWLLVRDDEGSQEIAGWSPGRGRAGEASASKFRFVLLTPGR